ncbi:MAG: RNA methyltransferase [Deltaproteobacteria bacterium]|nr:RNA methyltransferase [Deltaproteobacteria bacterium]
MNHIFTAIISRELEPALQKELRQLGLQHVVAEQGAVRFRGDYKSGLRAALWSRLASRILLRLHRFPCRDATDLYEGVQEVNWKEHLSPHGTLWIDFVGHSKTIRHSNFAAQRVKDAIVDQIRTPQGIRPSIQKQNPDLRLQVHLRNSVATINIDLCGDPLHLRSPNKQVLDAPLKETLAAAMLHLSDWKQYYKEGKPFYDPMCGSGTLLIEAAHMVMNRAPNLARTNWAFQRWKQHDPKPWKKLIEEADDLQKPLPSDLLFGADINPQAISYTKQNLAYHQLDIPLQRGSFFQLPPPITTPGLLIANPPYGERLEVGSDLAIFYKNLSDQLKIHYLGWNAHILSTNDCARFIALKSARKKPIFNGTLKCRLLHYPIRSAPPVRFRPNS